MGCGVLWIKTDFFCLVLCESGQTTAHAIEKWLYTESSTAIGLCPLLSLFWFPASSDSQWLLGSWQVVKSCWQPVCIWWELIWTCLHTSIIALGISGLTRDCRTISKFSLVKDTDFYMLLNRSSRMYDTCINNSNIVLNHCLFIDINDICNELLLECSKFSISFVLCLRALVLDGPWQAVSGWIMHLLECMLYQSSVTER